MAPADLAASSSGLAAPRRRVGKVAEQASLRARVELARVLGDASEERATAKELAERLASHDIEIDAAVDLALRTLGTHEDPELRFAVAGWLERLGEPALAASELRKIKDDTDAKVVAARLVRIGVLHARAGDVTGAHEALAEAAQLDEGNAISLEMLGAVVAWSPPGATTGETFGSGAEAYVRAAKRRAALGEADAELEDLLRAFELEPGAPYAAGALVAAHLARNHTSAADEVLRAHAAALHAREDDDDAAAVHARRRASAAESGDLAHAVSASIDAGLDAVFEGPSADAMDDLLARIGAFEPLSARLEIRAEKARGSEAARRWADLGRLLSGPLASPERALEAYARSIAADASNADTLHALRSLAQQTGNHAWLLEGLVRGVIGPGAFGASAEVAARLDAARSLATIAAELGEPALAAWARKEMLRLNDSSDDLDARAADEIRRREAEIEQARLLVSTTWDQARVEALEHLARLLAGTPTASRELATILSDVSRARPDDDALLGDAMRAAERVFDFAAVGRLCTERLSRTPSAPRPRIALVNSLRRGGNAFASAEAARELFDACTPWAYSVAWIAAACSGDRAMRARAIAGVAPTCAASVVATMLAIAAEDLAAAGETVEARRIAEQACRADPQDARALVSLASVVGPAESRVATTALERAVLSSGPTAPICAKLADAYETLGEVQTSVSWAQRVVTIRPGDTAAVDGLIARATRAGDAVALADTLAWLVPQPLPAKMVVERIAPALRALGDRDIKVALAVCRKALDVLGPRHAALREAALALASAGKDAALRALVIERWIAAGAEAAERTRRLIELGEAYAELGDPERELYAYVRAARAGADIAAVRPRIDVLEKQDKTPDAEIAWLEAHAELLHDDGKSSAAAAAYRDFGAALWDMADDRPRAVAAWLRAGQLDTVRGYTTLRRDLTSFADAQYAADCLSELFDREGEPVRSAMIATEAACAACEARAYPRALMLAKTAIERYPGHAAALETAERATTELGRVQDMSPLYDHVARRARGRFGRRAAHHRAARFFEAKRIPMLALKHAAQAFIAVPSEGTTLALLSRTADRAERRSVAVRTVEHVAELARGPGVRSAWLLRAAGLAARDVDGTRQRTDLLLKASVLSAAPGTVRMLTVAARDLVSLAPDDTEALSMRLEKASESLTKKLEGPDGARMALLFAELAIDLFNDGEWAWRALLRALDADADIDEYVSLAPHAPALASAKGSLEGLAQAIAACEKPYANIGPALLRLLGKIAGAAGQGATRAKALVLAAEKDEDNDDVVVEVDEALVAHADPALTERLSKKVGVVRRSDALRAVAARMSEAGNYDRATALLERALEIAPPAAHAEITSELKATLHRAGRGEDLILRELAAQGMSSADRAERWTELARLRKEKGDLQGATDALFQAATDDPSEARWVEVEVAAEISGRDHLRVEALQHLVKSVQPAERLSVLKRLARAEGARGALAAAETAWRAVWAVVPQDTEADVAIEALLVARSSYDELAEHLSRRAERLSAIPGEVETTRAVRLRRAALLEQRLGRLEDAAAELEMILKDSPNYTSALRWLAEIHGRMGQPARALETLDKVSEDPADPAQSEDIELRRIRAHMAADELDEAFELVVSLAARAPSSVEAREVWVEIARARQNPSEVGDALAELARVSPADARVRSEMLVEAAQAAARAAATDLSLARARDAAKLAPTSPATQLFARGLEYRLRGAGSHADALHTIESLDRIRDAESLEPEDQALRSFLLAEAQDVVCSGTGEATLLECYKRVGGLPLVSLGLAERAARSGKATDALRYYVDAVYGNLLGLRGAGQVALAAAQSARVCSDADAELRFLNEATKDPEMRLEALRQLAKLDGVLRVPGRARVVLRGLAEATASAERAEALAQLARVLFDSDKPAERLEADRTLREAIDGAPEDVAQRLRIELSAFRSRTPRPSVPPTRSVPPAATPARKGPTLVFPAPPPVLSGSAPDDEPAPQSQPEIPAIPMPAPVVEVPREDPKVARINEAKKKAQSGAIDEAEKMLSELVQGGSIEAADALDAIFAKDTAHSAGLLRVRRQAAELRPGEPARLHALCDAAKADHNVNYARAVEHVMGVFEGAELLPAPVLSAQNAQPGIMTLLTRHSREAGGEALGVVWEGAQTLFAKPPTTYGMTGTERVIPGPMSSLSRLLEVVVRLLDTPRFSLYHRRSDKPPTTSVALLASPAAILDGAGNEDSMDLRWALGHALASVLPQNVLVLGLVDTEAHALWQVLLGAFGPPEHATVAREHAALAELLWQTLPPRAQRRLKELLADAGETPYALVSERAKQSGRRVGMFLTGDFAHAARTVVGEHRPREVGDIGQPGGLARLCVELPALADLFRLAIRPEYADARWHTPTTPVSRLPPGGRQAV